MARLKLADEQFAGLKADRENILAQTRLTVWAFRSSKPGRWMSTTLADFPDPRKPLAAAVEVAE